MHRPTTVAAGVALSAAMACLCAGCGQSEQPAALPEADQIYADVRGRVTGLPGDGPIADPLFIKHEAIPEFVGWDGQVHANSDGTPGMKAMEMPFPELAPGVAFDGIEPGDAVAFTFAVAWEGRAPRYWLTDITELPADIELDLPGESDAGTVFDAITDAVTDAVDDAAETVTDTPDDTPADASP